LQMSLHFDSKLNSSEVSVDYTIDLWKKEKFLFFVKNKNV